MVNIIGWSIAIMMIIIVGVLFNSTVKTYKQMKEAKRKAMIWDARIK